jgi:hypothetical protein
MASRRTPQRRRQRWSPYDGAASRQRRSRPRMRLWKPLHRDRVASCRPRGARREGRGGAGRGPGPWKRRAAGPRGKPGRRRGDRPREAHRRPREKKREWKGTGRRRGRGSGRLAASGEACRRHPFGVLTRRAGADQEVVARGYASEPCERGGLLRHLFAGPWRELWGHFMLKILLELSQKEKK